MFVISLRKYPRRRTNNYLINAKTSQTIFNSLPLVSQLCSPDCRFGKNYQSSGMKQQGKTPHRGLTRTAGPSIEELLLYSLIDWAVVSICKLSFQQAGNRSKLFN